MNPDDSEQHIFGVLYHRQQPCFQRRSLRIRKNGTKQDRTAEITATATNGDRCRAIIAALPFLRIPAKIKTTESSGLTDGGSTSLLFEPETQSPNRVGQRSLDVAGGRRGRESRGERPGIVA